MELDRFDKLKILSELMGYYDLCNEIVKAMSEEQAKDIFDYIAKNWDIDFEMDQYYDEIEKL